MASITAVELGADSCVLVRASVRGGAIHVSAVETLDPAAFPGEDAFTVALKHARRRLKLPRRCRVVLWGLPDGANLKDIAVQPQLAPLTAAGFRVARVVTPCNALAALARVKSVRGDGATCWLTINRGGVAVVVVRPGKQLYSHTFVWDSSIGSSGSQARLLQRYSLVAILGPEVKRAMAEARKLGIAVEVVVTCGNLPDLRSLTMPLIEELDVEVETLDSLEGLVVKPAAAERLAEFAPALRLACAGLVARGTRPWDEKRRESSRRTAAALRFAAAAALVLGIGYAWHMRAQLPVVSALVSRATDDRPVAPVKPPWKPPAATPKPATPAVSDAAKRTESNPQKPEAIAPAPSVPAKGPESRGAVSAPAKRAESNPPAVSDPAKRTESNPQPSVAAAAARAMEIAAKRGAPVAEAKPTAPPTPAAAKSNPPVVSAPPAPTPNPAAVSDPAKRAESNPPVVNAKATTPPAPSGPVKSPESRGQQPRTEVSPPATPSGLNTSAVPADKPETARNRPLPALLKDSLPRVTTILVSSDRRFATIDSGQIIGIGDVLGRRVVVAIDERTVVLREPSGVQIRVGLGGRVVGVGRSDR
jgi:hypothetical protein